VIGQPVLSLVCGSVAAILIGGASLAAAPKDGGSDPSRWAVAPALVPPGRPLDMVRVVRGVCLAQQTAPAMVKAAEAAGYGPIISLPLHDPVGNPLTFRVLTGTEIDGLKVSLSIRSRLLSDPPKKPVEVTECGVIIERRNVARAISAELASTLGPGTPVPAQVPEATGATWSSRLTGNAAVPFVMSAAQDPWSGRDAVQVIGPNDAVRTVSVASAGPTTMVTVSIFRLAGPSA